MKLTEELNGKGSKDYGIMQTKLAGHYRRHGMYQKAEKLYNEAIPVIKTFGNSIEYGLSLLDFANLYIKQKQFEKAENLLIEAQNLQYIIPFIYRSSSLQLAEIYARQGKYNEAEKRMLEVLELDKEKFGEKSIYRRNAADLAGVYYMGGKNEKAISLFTSLRINYLEELNDLFDVLGEKEREQFYGTFLKFLQTYENFIVNISNYYPSQISELYNLQLATKSILLNTSNQIKRRILQSDDRVLIDLYDEVQSWCGWVLRRR